VYMQNNSAFLMHEAI